MNRAEAKALKVGMVVMADTNPNAAHGTREPVEIVGPVKVFKVPSGDRWKGDVTVTAIEVVGLDTAERPYSWVGKADDDDEPKTYLPTWGGFDIFVDDVRVPPHGRKPALSERVFLNVRHLQSWTNWADRDEWRAWKAEEDKLKRRQAEHGRRVEEWEEIAQEAANGYLPEGRGASVRDGVARLKVSAEVLRTILNEVAHPDTVLEIELPASLFAGPRPRIEDVP